MKVLLGIIGIGAAAWLLHPVSDALGAGGIGLILGGLGVLLVVIVVWCLASETQGAAYGHIERMAQLGQERESTRESHYVFTNEGGCYKQIEHKRW